MYKPEKPKTPCIMHDDESIRQECADFLAKQFNLTLSHMHGVSLKYEDVINRLQDWRDYKIIDENKKAVAPFETIKLIIDVVESVFVNLQKIDSKTVEEWQKEIEEWKKNNL